MEVSRIEQKYFLTYEESAVMRSKLQKIMPLDRYCSGGEGYELRSLYCDTVTDRCCAEKEEGLFRHEKIRIRVYGSRSDTIKLESKEKLGERQVKRTMFIERSTLDDILAGRYRRLLELPDPMAPYFYYRFSEGMRPKAIIQYKRIPFALDVNQIRVTFDYDIRATESSFDLFRPHLQTHPIFPENMVIMEVKYNNFLLGYIQKVLAEAEKSSGSFSKYFSGRSFYRRLI